MLEFCQSSPRPEQQRASSAENPPSVINEAYLREYTPAHPLRHFAITYPSDVERKSILPQQVSRSHGTTVSSDRRRGAQTLLLPGLGRGRQRNEYGKTIGGGQECGRGVIGSSAAAEDYAFALDAVQTSCDILPAERYAVKRSPSTQGSMMYTSEHDHQVSLNPDLPPLAIEHPARVWNAMLHSLRPEYQPVIKWEYTKVKLDGSEASPESPADVGDFSLVAHLTLTIPRTHPILIEHSLYDALPPNQWLSGYIMSAEAIGASKKWSGEPRPLKVSRALEYADVPGGRPELGSRQVYRRRRLILAQSACHGCCADRGRRSRSSNLCFGASRESVRDQVR